MQNIRRTWNARSARELTLITSVMNWMKWIWIRLKNSNCAHTACGTSLTKNNHISRKQHSCARNVNFITNWRNFTLTAKTRAPLPQTQLWSKYRFRGIKRLKDGHPKQSVNALPWLINWNHRQKCIWNILKLRREKYAYVESLSPETPFYRNVETGIRDWENINFNSLNSNQKKENITRVQYHASVALPGIETLNWMHARNYMDT